MTTTPFRGRPENAENDSPIPAAEFSFPSEDGANTAKTSRILGF
jgi:hypothetical protein